MYLTVRNTSKKMFVSSLNNIDYTFSVYDSNGHLVTKKYKYTDWLELEYYGKVRVMNIETLYLLTMLKINLLSEYADDILDNLNMLSGVHIKSHLRVTYLAWFNTPIEVKHDNKVFRIIPNIPIFAISENGDVLDLKTKDIKPFKKREIGFDGYPCIRLNNIKYRLHRLVASAWVANSDRLNRVIVDHIDGDKLNCHYTNLRWLTTDENNKLAVHQGLMPQATKCLVKNLNNGNIMEFNSLTEFTKYFGIARINSTMVKLGTGQPYLKSIGSCLYQIKYADDPIKWMSLPDAESLYKRKISRQYNLVVDSLCFHTLREISDYINNGKQYISLSEALDYIKNEMHKEFKLTYTELNDKYNYIGHNVMTGEVIYAKLASEFIGYTGISKSTIYKSIINNGSYIYGNWRFKHDDGEDFTEAVTISNSSKHIKATNSSGTKELVFKSIREAARYFNVDPKTIKHRLNTGEKLEHYKIEYC